jgi:hypothetical protein
MVTSPGGFTMKNLVRISIVAAGALAVMGAAFAQAPAKVDSAAQKAAGPTAPGKVGINRVPDSELVLVPGGTLITATPEEGRALALKMARHMIHNIQPDLNALKAGRPKYANNPDSLIAASQVVAIEFQTIAAANNYWRH